MSKVHQLVASCLGIGYARGGGTITAVLCCIVWYLARSMGAFNWVAIIVTMLVTVAGIWSAAKVEPAWGKDSNRVVIDEAAGMCVSLLLIPVELKYIIAGLVLFRFFDIAKPLLIRKTELLPGGWGVMMDDLLAGLYTNLLLHIIVWYNLF